MIIDGNGAILGRIATVAAKKALLGESIDIVNCENIIITGSRSEVLAKYQRFRRMGVPKKGPFIPRLPDRFVRKVIRRMLPNKTTRGRDAFHRVMCWRGIPSQFAAAKIQAISEASSSKLSTRKIIAVGELCKLLGGKVE